jgi:hypothetical protein
MPMLSINGQNVQVGDDFLSLSPDAQNSAVEEIAKGLGGKPYTSSILPFSYDAQGKRSFDPANAGITGALWKAFNTPADVVEGKVPMLGPDDHTSPQMIDRAANMASVIASPSPAALAGSRYGQMALPQPAAVPSAAELKAAGGAGYDAARNSGLEIAGDAVGQMAQGLQQTLQGDRGIIEKTAPKTFSILGELANPPQGATVGIPGLQAARRGLTGISMEGGTEGLAARQSIKTIDGFLENLDPASVVAGTSTAQDVSNTLRNANANYAAAQRSNTLTGELDRANTGVLDRAEANAAAANSGTNLDNSIRQRVRSLLANPKELAGFSQEEIDALNQVNKGTFTQNAARIVGNLLGGGGGLGAAAAGAVAGAGGSALGLGPTGVGAAALGAPVAGAALKMGENALARRGLNAVDELVRMRSPLYQQMQAAQPPMAPTYGRDAAIMRALGLGLLSPQQQPGMLTPQQPQTGLLSPY